ncbi:hypothetical protein GGR28_003701 [Lewinella aquimaris]|uniref:DinB-like domain-containing protein n=1 Tax=Neolewinella aquimaris TaxID=1835722 RepID=A0A840E5X7_9BACT|nr:DinB family protein [Neolewinella aquimaris]MBB4081054.1 hypothetical protein [Neolewinella aquimaris]
MDSAIAHAFTLHQQTRRNIHALMESMEPEQLNRIPGGLNNNLVWNAGHVIATHELLIYALGGHHTPSGKEFINRYRKGSRPAQPVTAEEIAYIKTELTEGGRRLQEAFGSLDWAGFTSYTTSFGISITSVGEAITFNNMHEAMHLGTMLTLRRLV